MPFVGVAFFIWVGIFNISLVAQFWSFANDIYTQGGGRPAVPDHRDRHDRRRAARLVRRGAVCSGSGVTPQVILQVSAVLLAASIAALSRGSTRARRGAPSAPASRSRPAAASRLVLGNRYLRLIAALIVLLNVVNTTGEYLVARLLTRT